MKAIQEYRQPSRTPKQVGEVRSRASKVPLLRKTELSHNASLVEPIPEGIRQEIVGILAEILVLDYQDYQKVIAVTVAEGGGLNRGGKGSAQEKSPFRSMVPGQEEPIPTPAERAL